MVRRKQGGRERERERERGRERERWEKREREHNIPDEKYKRKKEGIKGEKLG